MVGFLDNFDNDDYPLPYTDENKILILLTVKQAMKDLVNLLNVTEPSLRELWHTAFEFLFDDDHWVNWGGVESRLEDLLDVMDIDIAWVRRKMREQLEIALEKRKQRVSTKEKGSDI